jgi:acyl-CoA thioesterase-2
LFDLEEQDTDVFLGQNHRTSRKTIFGGQFVGQSLMAAARTVSPEWRPHSLHAYFLASGDTALPVTYRVARESDGRSFCNRRVSATQHDRTVFTMNVSFHAGERGLVHRCEMPSVPPPEALKSTLTLALERNEPADARRIHDLRLRPVEIRPVAPHDGANAESYIQCCWLKPVAPVTAAPIVHDAILAFASDMTLLTTSLVPHNLTFYSPGLRLASLDHSIWFHAHPDVNAWLLYAMDSPWAGEGRSISRGHIFTQAGKLVASVMQEGLVRLREDFSQPFQSAHQR